MKLILDTHALIWLVNGDSQLPTPVKRKIQAAEHQDGVAVSAMSFWEIALLYKKERLRLPVDVETWLKNMSEQAPHLKVIDPNTDILIKSVTFPDSFPQDPVDRIIAATALSLGATLITKDRKIRQYKKLQTWWG